MLLIGYVYLHRHIIYLMDLLYGTQIRSNNLVTEATLPSMEQDAEKDFLKNSQDVKQKIEVDQKDIRCGFWKFHGKKLQL